MKKKQIPVVIAKSCSMKAKDVENLVLKTIHVNFFSFDIVFNSSLKQSLPNISQTLTRSTNRLISGPVLVIVTFFPIFIPVVKESLEEQTVSTVTVIYCSPWNVPLEP
jgi:hypothetical protein